MRFAAFLLLFSLTCSAQGTFRIYDASMNDVTGTSIFVSDTNTGQQHIVFTVENTDSVSHNVRAGRNVIAQPVGAANAFIWNQLQYVPSADSSLPEPMSASGMLGFEAYYFPNNNNDTAVIEYCFWETADPGNRSCVTVTFEHVDPLGWANGTVPAVISYGPNPAADIIGFGWGGYSMTRMNIYDSEGKLFHTRSIAPDEGSVEFDLSTFPQGIFFFQLIDDEGNVHNYTAVHIAE